MYEWRKLPEEERRRLLARRRKLLRPWHGPPHFESVGPTHFHLSAACYEHRPTLGAFPARMAAFEAELTGILSSASNVLHAWCILPNHWHALVRVETLKGVLADIGRLHGRSSFRWNREDAARGRKCWHRCADRRIRSDRHFYATRNYIHHNPVKHAYVDHWDDWPFSSAAAYISEKGRDTILEEWEAYPVLGMGSGWDD